MNLKTYRVCSAVRVWNDRMKCFVNQISYIEDYSPCEIDMTAYKNGAQRFSLERAQQIVDRFNELDHSEGCVYWVEEYV